MASQLVVCIIFLHIEPSLLSAINQTIIISFTVLLLLPEQLYKFLGHVFAIAVVITPTWRVRRSLKKWQTRYCISMQKQWNQVNAPSHSAQLFQQQSQGCVLPSVAGMSVVRANTSIPAVHLCAYSGLSGRDSKLQLAKTPTVFFCLSIDYASAVRYTW